MSNRLLVGNLVTFSETSAIDDSQPQIGVILKIHENDEVDVAVPNSNPAIRYLPKIADISSIQKVTRQMVTNGTITQDQYDKGREFEIEMEDEMVTSTNDNVIKRATGGSKRRRRVKRSTKRRRRSSQKRRRRTMRK
jgi:hypothetical protein